MILTPKLKAALPDLLPILLSLPDDTPVEPHFGNADLAIQCYSQERVKELRSCFFGTIWTKKPNEFTGKWEYRTTWNGLAILLYACQEAPPSCRAVTRTVTVKRSVPVAFEEREVEESVTEWHCGDEEASDAA